MCAQIAQILPLKFEAQTESPSHNSQGVLCDAETVVITASFFLLLAHDMYVKKSGMCIAVHLVFLLVSCTLRSLLSSQYLSSYSVHVG